MGNPKGVGGRIAGIPNRDKAELRALIQERVHEFTMLRRAADLAAGMSEDDAQDIVEDYDPVVQMAMFAVDRRSTKDQQMRAADSVAQYVRPKLKSIEMTSDGGSEEEIELRRELSQSLVNILKRGMADKKREGEQAALRDGSPDAPPPLSSGSAE